MIRDVLVMQVPTVLHTEIYVTAAIAGAAVQGARLRARAQTRAGWSPRTRRTARTL